MVRKDIHSNQQRRLLLGAFVGMLVIVVGSIIFSIRADRSNEPAKSSPPHATITTRPTQVTPTAQPPARLLFFDEFTDNINGWAISDGAGYTRTMSNGNLLLSGTNHKSLIESIPTNTIFSDFLLTTTFTLQAGDKNDSVGLFLRGDSNLDHDYRVDIFGDSSYTISKESLDEDNQQTSEALVDHARTPWLQGMGKQNVLTIIMKGPQIVMILNGAVVNSITDTDYTRGQIALFVENGASSDGISAEFNSIIISAAPNHLPGDIPAT